MAVAGAYVPYSTLVARHAWVWSPSLLLGLAFPFALTPYAFFISPYFGSKKLLRTNRNLQGTLRYVFSDQGIEVSGPHSHADLEWTALSEVRESSSQFVLYPHQSIAHVIPKSFLASPHDVSVLRNLLKQHVTKTRLKKA
jgi:hypothetical protein